MYLHQFLIKVPRQFNRKKITFLTNDTETIVYLYVGKWISTIFSCNMQKLTQNGSANISEKSICYLENIELVTLG